MHSGVGTLGLRDVPRPALVLAGATGSMLLTAAAAFRFGPVALLLPLAAVATLLLLPRPDVSLGLFLGIVVLAESDPEGFTPTARLYETALPGLTLLDLLLMLVIAGVLIDCAANRRALRLPGPLTLPFAVLLAGMAAGAVMGYFAGTPNRVLISTLLVLLYMIVTPVLVVTIITTVRQVRRLLGAAAALIGLKALVGILAVFGGFAPPDVDGARITYYEPTANWLIVLLVLAIAAGALRRARLPPWTMLLGPVALVALVLSYRRSFWIVAVIGLVLVVLFGLSRLQRRLAVPTAVVLVASVWITLSAGIPTSLQGPVIDRAKSLSPTAIANNRTDRYRIDERENVVADLRETPLVGLGVGVPWTVRQPLLISDAGARQYTHVAVLWYWMKLGLLGPIAYLAFMLTAAAMGLGVLRNHPDPWIACAGLALFAGLIGLMAGELTATFTGADVRFTIIMGAIFGLLVVMRRQWREPEPALTGS